MRTSNYNLQLLHHDEVFATRELAIKYLTDYYKPNSLEAEPIFVKYGEAANPDVILAFGTTSEAPGGFYIIDMTKATTQIEQLTKDVETDKAECERLAQSLTEIVNAAGFDVDDNKIKDKITYKPDSKDNVIGTAVTIAEAIDLLSKYAQNGFNTAKLSVEDTNTLRLIYQVNPNGGMILKGEVAVSTGIDNNELNFDNNIIGIKSDGISASVNLAYDDARHQLIFTTSGYKNGRFQDDAIVQKIDLGKHTKLVANNDNKTVKIALSEDETNYTTTISADVQISSNEDNLLTIKDGKLFVSDRAKDIKYGNTTVAGALYNQGNRLNDLDSRTNAAAKSAHVEGGVTDTIETSTETLADGGAKVTGTVRLGTTNSIVVRNGGLEANVNIDVDAAANKLIVTIGNQTVEKALPGVELFESMEYNDENEELIIHFKTGSSVRIPIHAVIHTWDVDNLSTSPVVLTKTIVTGGTDKLSADVTLRSTDNLLSKENGNLFVSESSVDAKVSVETQRSTEAEKSLQTNIDNFKTEVENDFIEQTALINANKESITTEKDRASAVEAQLTEMTNALDTKIDTEIQRAEKNETDLESKIETLENSVEKQFTSHLELINTNKDAIVTERERATSIESQLSEKCNTANINITTLRSDVTTNKASIETLRGDLANETSLRTNADTDIIGKINLTNATLTNEISRATDAENANTAKIEELGTKTMTNLASTLTQSKEYTNAQVLAEKNERISDISNVVATINDIKFVTAESDSIRMTMDKQTGDDNRTLKSEVKIKTITASDTSNIIKSDANGIYATVSFKYDKASNKITFNDGNGEKEFELSNYGIIEDAYYDSQEKQIVLVIKQDDQTTKRLTIPVGDLVNTWDVENSTTSPIVLTKTKATDKDVLSADISILNNAHNLLVKQNGSLFVDSDSNKHIALWNTEETTVQGAINILKERTDGYDTKIATLTQTVADNKTDVNQKITETNTNVSANKTSIDNLRVSLGEESVARTNADTELSGKIGTVETKVSTQESRITKNETTIGSLQTKVEGYDAKITQASESAANAVTLVSQLKEQLGDIASGGKTVAERLATIEETLSKLIDFGNY